jgi:hypothetical protein
MRALVFAALAAAALLLCLSCTTGTDGEEGVPHDQTSVLGTLLLFVDVWNDCDIDTYKGLLDEDTFTFYFAPEDVEYGLPLSWEYTEEIEAVTKLFDALGAENVDVQLDLDGVTEPESEDGTYRVNGIPYEVRVYDEAAEPEPILYLAEGWLNMELKKVESEWVITIWWDIFSQRLLGCEMSWGMIKASF